MSDHPFALHVTLKWPAYAGAPDIMVNVYADAQDELDARLAEALAVVTPRLPELRPAAAATPADGPTPRQQQQARADRGAAMAQKREEPRYVPDDLDGPGIACAHGLTDWRESQYRKGEWYMAARPGFDRCGCQIDAHGEVTTAEERDRSKFQQRPRRAGGAR